MKQSDLLWSQTILKKGSIIREAVELLNKTSLKIVLVVDNDGKFLGTISDGDIRRGLLKGIDLTSKVDLILNNESLLVPKDLHREVVLKLMTANKIQQIPIVDEKMRVVGLHLWDELKIPESVPNIMVVMAGGKGTRLHPYTENCPKPLIRIAGKPILQHILDSAKNQGFTNFVFAIHHLGNMIEDYFGNGARFGVKIEYLREQYPTGTAGALKLINPLPDFPIVVSNGDVLTEINYREVIKFHEEQNARATMAIRNHEWQNPFGVVETSGVEITGYSEKPTFKSKINAGIYVLSPQTLSLIPSGSKIDMPTLFELIKSKKLKTVAYPIHEKWIDIGHPDELQLATADMENKGEI
jgi:dTDP-glucose pyrophosphorylase